MARQLKPGDFTKLSGLWDDIKNYWGPKVEENVAPLEAGAGAALGTAPWWAPAAWAARSAPVSGVFPTFSALPGMAGRGLAALGGAMPGLGAVATGALPGYLVGDVISRATGHGAAHKNIADIAKTLSPGSDTTGIGTMLFGGDKYTGADPNFVARGIHSPDSASEVRRKALEAGKTYQPPIEPWKNPNAPLGPSEAVTRSHIEASQPNSDRFGALPRGNDPEDAAMRQSIGLGVGGPRETQPFNISIPTGIPGVTAFSGAGLAEPGGIPTRRQTTAQSPSGALLVSQSDSDFKAPTAVGDSYQVGGSPLRMKAQGQDRWSTLNPEHPYYADVPGDLVAAHLSAPTPGAEWLHDRAPGVAPSQAPAPTGGAPQAPVLGSPPPTHIAALPPQNTDGFRVENGHARLYNPLDQKKFVDLSTQDAGNIWKGMGGQQSGQVYDWLKGHGANFDSFGTGNKAHGDYATQIGDWFGDKAKQKVMPSAFGTQPNTTVAQAPVAPKPPVA